MSPGQALLRTYAALALPAWAPDAPGITQPGATSLLQSLGQQAGPSPCCRGWGISPQRVPGRRLSPKVPMPSLSAPHPCREKPEGPALALHQGGRQEVWARTETPRGTALGPQAGVSPPGPALQQAASKHRVGSSGDWRYPFSLSEAWVQGRLGL